MKVLIALLLSSFIIGGSVRWQHLTRRPLIVVAVCIVLAASFLSQKIAQ